MDGIIPNGNTAPLLVDARQAARLCGLGRTSFLAADRTGELGPRSIRLGRRRLWSVSELASWVRRGCPPHGVWLPLRDQPKEAAA